MTAVQIIEEALEELGEIQPEYANFPIKTVSGKIIKKTRLALGMSQPHFAKFLSKQSGNYLDTKTLCRIENYGEKDACHPLPPSLAIKTAVHSINLILKEKKGVLKKMTKKNTEYMDLKEAKKLVNKEILDLVFDSYLGLGIFPSSEHTESQEKTATEIIEEVLGTIINPEVYLPKADKLEIENKLKQIEDDFPDNEEKLKELKIQIEKILQDYPDLRQYYDLDYNIIDELIING